MFRALPNCAFNERLILFTSPCDTRTHCRASLTFTCHHGKERFTICTLRRNLASANFAAIRSLTGLGGTIAIGPPTSLIPIPSRNAPFSQRQYGNTRFDIRVLGPVSGVCALNSRP